MPSWDSMADGVSILKPCEKDNIGTFIRCQYLWPFAAIILSSDLSRLLCVRKEVLQCPHDRTNTEHEEDTTTDDDAEKDGDVLEHFDDDVHGGDSLSGVNGPPHFVFSPLEIIYPRTPDKAEPPRRGAPER
jgi:hypothetical protein